MCTQYTFVEKKIENTCPKYSHLLPGLAPWLTLSGSNYPCLEQFLWSPSFQTIEHRLCSDRTSCTTWERTIYKSTLVISKSKRFSEIFRDILTSKYQICRIEEKIIQTTHFTNEYVIWPLKLEMHRIYCGKEEKLLLRSNFSSFPQYFVTWY